MSVTKPDTRSWENSAQSQSKAARHLSQNLCPCQVLRFLSPKFQAFCNLLVPLPVKVNAVVIVWPLVVKPTQSHPNVTLEQVRVPALTWDCTVNSHNFLPLTTPVPTLHQKKARLDPALAGLHAPHYTHPVPRPKPLDLAKILKDLATTCERNEA